MGRIRRQYEDDLKSARFVGIEGLMKYTGLGRNTALKIGTDSGAKAKIGKRAIYDLRKIDAYIGTMCGR
jgi:hypothetical protein